MTRKPAIPSTSYCKWCGQDIVWRKVYGRWTPLELTGVWHNCPDYQAKKPSAVTTRAATPEELARMR